MSDSEYWDEFYLKSGGNTFSLGPTGELALKYAGWEIMRSSEGILADTKPGDIRYEYAYEKITARRTEY